MNKNFLYISLIASSVLAFSACTDEDNIANGDNSGKQAIELQVGMAGSGPASRAITNLPEVAKLSTLPTGTTLYMVMKSEAEGKDAKWTMTKATTGVADSETKASPVSFTESGTARYWDDVYARDAAVSVYGICTPGGTTNTPAIGGKSVYAFMGVPTTGAWETTANSLTLTNWTVRDAQADLSAQAFADQDLCYTNNVSSNSTGDNRMKFGTQTSGKFDKGDLVFYHALTKVTINMTAGDGFDAADSKKAFVSPATATIHGFKTQGDFELTAGVVSNQTAEKADITTFLTNDDKSGTAEVVTRSAIVMPGRTLAATDKILTVSADGNPYDVTAAELVAAMPESKVMLQGTEYIINIRISKTAIKVTATIKDWDTVTAADETPLINVTTSYGQEGTNFGKGFSFLRSTSINDGYANNATVDYADSKYTMTPQLYWPNHSTHYFFRGVWPLIGDATDGSQTLSSNVSASAISVTNGAYAEGKYPSDLMLGYPRTTSEACPHGNTVATSGICATEGEIRMNFQYVMSQVEVNLQTSDGADKVVFDSHTEVDIVGAYTDGTILLSDGSATLSTKPDYYTMHRKGASDVNYHDAIISQNVEALKFRITVTDTDGNQDKYETVFAISEIKVTEDGVEKDITAWEPGKHYVYKLLITKTGIKVTATIKDWITATGGTSIWM